MDFDGIVAGLEGQRQRKMAKRWRKLGLGGRRCVSCHVCWRCVHQLLIVASNLELMQNWVMRTTVTLDDETHEFVVYYARAKGISLGAAIDELIRKAQKAPPAAPPEILRSESGFPMFAPTGRTITSEMVKKLEEEEFDPKNFA